MVSIDETNMAAICWFFSRGRVHPEVLLQLAIDGDWDEELTLLATLVEKDETRVFDKVFNNNNNK